MAETTDTDADGLMLSAALTAAAAIWLCSAGEAWLTRLAALTGSSSTVDPARARLTWAVSSAKAAGLIVRPEISVTVLIMVINLLFIFNWLVFNYLA
jgi:hypothetical protein